MNVDCHLNLLVIRDDIYVEMEKRNLKFCVPGLKQSSKMYFKGRNFRGKRLSRIEKFAKILHFAGINFRE